MGECCLYLFLRTGRQFYGVMLILTYCTMSLDRFRRRLIQKMKPPKPQQPKVKKKKKKEKKAEAEKATDNEPKEGDEDWEAEAERKAKIQRRDLYRK